MDARKTIRTIARTTLTLALCAALAACGGGGGGGGTPDPPSGRLTLTGEVQTASGAPLANAAVLLGQSPSVTDTGGGFSYPNLLPGRYVVSLQSAAGSFDCQEITLSETSTNFTFILPHPADGFHVSSVQPGLNSTGASLSGGLQLVFSENVDPGSVSAGDFSLTPASGTLQVQVSGKTITLRPSIQLPRDQNVLVELQGAVSAQAGAALAQPVRWRFRTAATDTFPPVLVSTEPAEGATGYPPNLALSFDFGEALAPKDPQLTASSDPAAALAVSVTGRNVLVDAIGGWQVNTSYTVELRGVADAAGNRSVETFTLHFRTGNEPAPFRDIQPGWNRVLDTVVFASNRAGGYDIYRMQSDGSNILRLTSMPGDELHPSLSSDGQLLCFQKRGPAGDWEIYVQALDDGEAVNVTSSNVNDYEPVFSSTSSRDIFFTSDRTGTASIFQMRSDGSGPEELDRNFGSQAEPAPHPLLDRQLLFTADRNGNRGIWRKTISVADSSVDNSNLTQSLVSNEHSPCWSPDASAVGFVSDLGGVDNLWVIDSAGNFPRQVTFFDYAVSDPVLAPIVGDNRCLVALDTAQGGTHLVLVDLVSGEILLDLSHPGA